MNEGILKVKIVKRIVTYCELYINDFENLVKLDLEKLVKLEQMLLIGLMIKYTYKHRHKNI